MIKILLFSLISSFCIGQTTIKIEADKELSDDIFNALAPYKVIWVGEMHGANEPALFAESITELLLRHQKRVTFGFEIIQRDLPKKMDSLSIVNSNYGLTYENRATYAWLNLILKMERNNTVKTIYFDENSEFISNEVRDSLMAVNILNKWDQNSTLVLLSGNLHNMQEPRNGSKKAALQLLDLSSNSFKILSLNHSFKSGQMLTSYSKDSEKVILNDFDFSKSQWIKEPMYEQNHLYISEILNYGWNGHFYIERVTPAQLIGK